MKKVLVIMAMALVISSPFISAAAVDVSIGVSIGLPPPIVFQTPPTVIVLPDAPDVYVVPYLELDLFFWNGWWWRPWEGRWYRSRYYDREWVVYKTVPRFYYDVDPGWRGYYQSRTWQGYAWHYQPIPAQKVKSNWRGWQKNRYWERQRTWNVQSYRPLPQTQRQDLRFQRQEQYRRNQEMRNAQQHSPQEQRVQEQNQYPPHRPGMPRIQEQHPPLPQMHPSEEQHHQPGGDRDRRDSRGSKSQGRHGDRE